MNIFQFCEVIMITGLTWLCIKDDFIQEFIEVWPDLTYRDSFTLLYIMLAYSEHFSETRALSIIRTI